MSSPHERPPLHSPDPSRKARHSFRQSPTATGAAPLTGKTRVMPKGAGELNGGCCVEVSIAVFVLSDVSKILRRHTGPFCAGMFNAIDISLGVGASTSR